jgi:hypothetical protein
MIQNLFLCMGAQRAGTTWLHSQLVNHPEIGFSDRKEIHYFDAMHSGSLLLARNKVDQLGKVLRENRLVLERYFTDLSSGKPVHKGIQALLSPVNDQWYIRRFVQNKKKYASDFSPEYALLPDAGFENINRVCLNKKILFIMRDPIERAKSAMRYFFKMRNKNIQDVSKKEFEQLALSDFIIGMSSYQITIQRLRKHFDDKDLLFLFFEDMMQEKQATINRITRFLEIAETALLEAKSERRVNETHVFDFPSEIHEILKINLKNTYSELSILFPKLPKSWEAVWQEPNS